MELLEDSGRVILRILVQLVEIFLERWIHGGKKDLPRVDAVTGFQGGFAVDLVVCGL